MAAPKRGLGRGLGALLGEATVRPAAGPVASDTSVVAVPVDAIVPNPRQPRRTFAAEPLDELRSSIATFGVLVPILVRRLDGSRYELIAGERRWRAAVAAGLSTVPAIVRAADDRESLEVAIVENLQRENLDPLEEAMGFGHLLEAYGLSQEEVALRVGRTRPAVTNALRLLTLSDPIKALVHERRLSAGAARALLALPVERRDAVARRAADEGLSVRAIEALAKPVQRATRGQQRADPDAAELVDRLRYRYATHIGLVRRERGGSIEIRFADEGELLRIVDLLLG